VTDVSRGMGAEIAIGASVSRSTKLRVRHGAAFSCSRAISRDCSGSRLTRPWRCRFITFVIMCYRRHPRVISPRDAPSADRASRRTVARARSAENLRIELLSWGVQKPPDHPSRDLHALDANGQGRAPSWRFMVTEERALVSVIGPTAGSGVRIEHWRYTAAFSRGPGRPCHTVYLNPPGIRAKAGLAIATCGVTERNTRSGSFPQAPIAAFRCMRPPGMCSLCASSRTDIRPSR